MGQLALACFQDVISILLFEALCFAGVLNIGSYYRCRWDFAVKKLQMPSVLWRWGFPPELFLLRVTKSPLALVPLH
jgi:hypothetical protein